MANRYILSFTPDAFRQNFRNLVEDLEGFATSLAGTVLLAGRSGGQGIVAATRADEFLGLGTATPSARVQLLDSTDVVTAVIAQNSDAAGTALASAQFRASASTAQVQLVAHGSGRTLARYGLTMGGWAELVSFAGNGLVLGTSIAAPLILGTNALERMQILSTGTILTYQHLATTAAFSKNNATLANVTGLSFNVDAGRTYLFRAELPFTADAVGGHKYAISGTCTATSIYYQVTSISNPTNALVITSRQTALAGAVGQGGATSGHTTIFGRIVVNAAGTLTVQFAQNAAVNTSQLEAGASFQIYPV